MRLNVLCRLNLIESKRVDPEKSIPSHIQTLFEHCFCIYSKGHSCQTRDYWKRNIANIIDNIKKDLKLKPSLFEKFSNYEQNSKEKLFDNSWSKSLKNLCKKEKLQEPSKEQKTNFSEKWLSFCKELNPNLNINIDFQRQQLNSLLEKYF